ncbi:hypothetical protein HGM15179_021261 [Zosterops borbonicus]|uniref:Uncharacterized protein n=1 Tax=Zosterops borbonicus TaxID=364589 RepID=A0A8K1FX62_9PASS|nr:hypothetical protein HGM15179_021261 [Zosterops borbonicus]
MQLGYVDSRGRPLAAVQVKFLRLLSAWGRQRLRLPCPKTAGNHPKNPPGDTPKHTPNHPKNPPGDTPKHTPKYPGDTPNNNQNNPKNNPQNDHGDTPNNTQNNPKNNPKNDPKNNPGDTPNNNQNNPKNDPQNVPQNDPKTWGLSLRLRADTEEELGEDGLSLLRDGCRRQPRGAPGLDPDVDLDVELELELLSTRPELFPLRDLRLDPARLRPGRGLRLGPLCFGG